MGQRLVVDIINKGKLACKVYYHWSGYSYPAYVEIRDLIESINDDPLKDIIQAISDGGGGFRNSSYKDETVKAAVDLFGKEFVDSLNPFPDRNNGLMAIGPDDMEDMDGWAEARAEINLDHCTFRNETVMIYDDVKDFIARSWKEYTPEEIEKFPVSMFFQDLPFDKIDEAMEECHKLNEIGGFWAENFLCSLVC